MLILLRVGYPMKKSAKAPLYPSSQASEEHTQMISNKKPAVLPAFVQFRLEFGETEILSDLSRHRKLDIFGHEALQNFTLDPTIEKKKCYNLWRDMYRHRHLNGTPYLRADLCGCDTLRKLEEQENNCS
jgi:hypothetical protein